jgi:hypothetical protein
MAYFSHGSPSFKLFWADVGPIAKRVAIDIWKSSVTLAITVLASPEVRSIVESHFGTVVGIGFATIVGLVVSGRLVKDNSKG